MDPDVTLADARRLIDEAHETGSDFDDLSEHFTALDGWLTRGGFLPEDWKRNEREMASRLRDTRNALLLFGTHPGGCSSWHKGGCSCGLQAALDEAAR